MALARERRNIFVGNPEGMRRWGRCGCTEMAPKQIGPEDADWTHLAHDRDQRWAVLNAGLKLPVSLKCGELLHCAVPNVTVSNDVSCYALHTSESVG